MRDAEIDLTDIPRSANWDKAVVGKFYRPIKKSLTIHIDADVLAWLKKQRKGYQTRINGLLRNAMHGTRPGNRSPVSKSRCKLRGEATPRASSNYDEFLLCIGWHRTQGVFAPVFQNQHDRLLEIRQTLFPCPPLPFRPRHLGAIGDEPRTVLLNNRCELVAH